MNSKTITLTETQITILTNIIKKEVMSIKMCVLAGSDVNFSYYINELHNITLSINDEKNILP